MTIGATADLPVHRAASLCPAMDEPEFRALVYDIKGRGLVHPIVLTEDGEILDGRHRYLEMFARGSRSGWTSWGAEAEAPMERAS